MPKEKINIKAKDGAEIIADVYGPESGNAKAVLIVCHGFGEHAGMYGEFAEKCAGAVTVKEYDCRHAIHSDVRREDYYRDLAAYLNRHL